MEERELQSLAEALLKEGLTVAAAESLSGGRVATALTAVAGSSAYFLGGVVAYSNQLKIELLGVPLETILRHGAVSEECARAMASGVARKLGAEAALATTGIAGPDGGSPDKPVGLVWLAACRGGRTVTARRIFDGGRERISSAAADEALRLLGTLL